MIKPYLIIFALFSIFLYSCSEVKKDKLAETVPPEEETILPSKVEKEAVEVVKPAPTPKIDTLTIEGTLIKTYNTGIEGITRIVIDGSGEDMEFDSPTDHNGESLKAYINNKVQITYYDKVINSEFDIQIGGITIHNGSEFEATEDAPYKWRKVEGVLSANTLSNGVPKPIIITSNDGTETIINSYVNQTHLDNNGKVVTAYYGEERLHNAISISIVEQVTYHSPFLGVWGPVTSPTIIADAGEEGYFISFEGGDAGFVKANINADSISGTNFSGKFTIKMISTNPPQLLYSDDGRGHFAPVEYKLKKNADNNNINQLVGKWQSTEDANSIMEYTPYAVLDYYDGELLSKEPYSLAPKCMNSSEVSRPLSSGCDYISVIGSDMCWYIESIDENNLTLSYTQRGNTLKYKRVK